MANYFNSQSDQTGQLQSLSTKSTNMISYLRASLSSLLRSDGHDGNSSVMSAQPTARRSNPSTPKRLVHHGSSTWLEQPSVTNDVKVQAPTLDPAAFPPLPTTTPTLPSNHDKFYDAKDNMDDATTESKGSFLPVTILRRYSPIRHREGPDHPSSPSTLLLDNERARGLLCLV